MNWLQQMISMIGECKLAIRCPLDVLTYILVIRFFYAILLVDFVHMGKHELKESGRWRYRGVVEGFSKGVPYWARPCKASAVLKVTQGLQTLKNN